MRTSRLLTLLAALLAGVLLLGACGGDDDDDAAPADDDAEETASEASEDEGDEGAAVVVKATEFAFDPDSLNIKAGEATTITLENGGAVEHDFTVDEADFKILAKATETTEGELTVDEAGEYTWYCSVPGHRQAGMEGTLVVE